MGKLTARQHEVAFCAEVSKWCDQLFANDEALPFGSSDIESFGTGSNKRQDFRVYERSAHGKGKLALCGEVKLPGTPQGRSPFDPILLKDAFDKATAENCRYFFTWNVENLALFDRAKWDAPTMHERCIGTWELGLRLNHPTDVTRAEVVAKLRDDFVPRFFRAYADIYTERQKDFALPPQDFYIYVLETHLNGPKGPVRELANYLALQADKSVAFDSKLREWMVQEQQWNFDRAQPDSWREVIDRAARSIAYVLSNRILFYQAIRARNDLPELRLPAKAQKDPQRALAYLRARFEEAVECTGDYEPIFFPDKEDWPALVALSGEDSLAAWEHTIDAIERFNFKEIPADILGGTFQKLISPEERHKFGQHYTHETIVDVINAFCIRKGNAVVFDPACGSGSFLVRAWYRKFQLDKSQSHQELLAALYGCDINPFPAHLATLNLAARNISNEENYPRIAHRNFFTVAPREAFCELPRAAAPYEGRRAKEKIYLPELDAVVGNPPYVRQENIPKAADKNVIPHQAKEFIYAQAERAYPTIKLSRQSDLHIYFWPVAAQFLKPDGWFGFLTSSSWLDAKYGFALHRWILSHFRLVAVIESVDEPWFEDARIKTVAALMQRCDDADKRAENPVRFVRLLRPLNEILGERKDERDKQEAADELRDLIVSKKRDFANAQLRIMVKRQGDLWSEGLSVAEMFARQKALAGEALAENEEGGNGPDTGGSPRVSKGVSTNTQGRLHGEHAPALDYGGGKWGRYLRAPDFYFELMREFGPRFVRMGDVATIKRGITSGCDAFFMPRNVSAELLEKNPGEHEWNSLPLMRRCPRADVESGKIVIAQCGDKTLHPLESEFTRPEVHSLMQVDRPVVTPEQLGRVVLWVNQPLPDIKGTHAYHFIKWGSKQTFESKKSKPVPVPERPGCAGRPVWYNLTGLQPGIGFWPMAQQYRHIIPSNPARLVCNHNLFDIHAPGLDALATRALMPVLNSTLLAFIKPFYGRYAGTEGNLKTEVVDTLLLEIPDPRHISEAVLSRLEAAFTALQQRKVTHLVEESFRNCHTAEEVRAAEKLPLGLPLELQRADRRALDDAVFELLGVADAHRRQDLIDRLYREVALHYRAIRIIEVQKMEQRRTGGGSGGKVSPLSLAQAACSDLAPEWRVPLAEWLAAQTGPAKTVTLPDGEARLPEAGNFFEAATVYFGRKPAISLECESRAEAELIAAVAATGLRGPVSVPNTETECQQLHAALTERLQESETLLGERAAGYAGTAKLRAQVLELLRRWFVHGKYIASGLR